MNLAQRLASELDQTLGALSVEEIAPGAYRVLLPLGPLIHDSLLLSVESVPDGWIVSDAAMTKFLIDDELEELTEHLVCAGAPFHLEGRHLVAHVEQLDSLAEMVRAFGYYLSATPVVWQALACARMLGTRESAPPAVELMARETRADLVARFGRKYDSVIRLSHLVYGRGNEALAPLAVATPGGQTVRLVASFIDLAASKLSVTSAKRATSFLLDVLEERRMAKFVLIRGDESGVQGFANLYEHEGANVVSTEQKEPFVEAAYDACVSLVGT